MQLYYKSKDYEYEHEWRYAIKNEGNNKQRFPFVHAIITGKDINQANLSKLYLIADKLSIPIYQQKINNSKNGFEYVVIKSS